MTEKVVSLRGAPVPVGAEAVPDVVELAKQILERAEAGEVIALMTFCQHADSTFTYQEAGPVVSYGMMGMVGYRLHNLYVSEAEADDD